MNRNRVFAFLLLATVAGYWIVQGGNLEPPGPPAPTMKTLDQVESRTPINVLPFTINSGGSYYLTQNLIGSSGITGITIQADDVTIDLNGFALIGELGVPGSDEGIQAIGTRKNVTVKNGTVRRWFGGDGVNLSGVSNALVINVRAEENFQTGIRVGANREVDPKAWTVWRRS